MPQLLIFRHAKASRKAAGGDKDRALEQRGREAALRMGAWMRDEGLQPDLALVSDARRTRETFAYAQQQFTDKVASRYEPRIYEASAETLLRLARLVDPEAKRVLLVGHNPGAADLATQLCGGGDMRAMATMRLKFPTGALAVLTFDGGWASLHWGGAQLLRFVTPASLSAGDDED